MRIENEKEKIILTEKEAQILFLAKDIIDNIYTDTQNDDIITYVEYILENLDNLLEPREHKSFEVVQEKHTKNGSVTLVAIEF